MAPWGQGNGITTCITYDPPVVNMPVGATNKVSQKQNQFYGSHKTFYLQLSLKVTMKGIKFWMPFVYRKKHNVYLIDMYGSHSLFFETNWHPNKSVPSIRNSYALHLVKFKQINSDENPCEESDREIDLEECLQKYIEDQINCTIPWGTSTSQIREPCQTENQFKQYKTLARTIRFLGEPNIYGKTGCRSNCDVMRYKMKKRYQFYNHTSEDEVRGP